MAQPFVVLLCTVAAIGAFSVDSAGAQVVVTVDPKLGNDSTCLSAQEAIEALNASSSVVAGPCATLNRALGDVDCGSNGSCLASGGKQLSEVVIMLADGVHRLTGEIQFSIFNKRTLTVVTDLDYVLCTISR